MKTVMTAPEIPSVVPKVWMSATECAAYLSITMPSEYSLVHDEKIPHHYRGRRLMFNKNEIDQWLMSTGKSLEDIKKQIEEENKK